jgi:V/A-type H+-transporting ATPase subunit A
VFTHRIMVPFNMYKNYTVQSIKPAGNYKVHDVVAVLADEKGESHDLCLSFLWPVKRAITCYEERYRPTEPLVTQTRIMDTFFPVARGGTFCVPGPFGAGKTVLQQTTSQNADVDIVIVAACGERAGEVVEILKEFPELTDPKTGKSLMERTVIICNTSSMPVAAREASLYTAVTMAEYYRQMGLHVLLLADSTSRWAQALREMSGRLEEIPGEEAFPAYMESTIAGFYERAGLVRLKDGTMGSVTIGGTVSPAGGNFEEPVTQATLKVVGAFHGLSRERSDARKFPAIHPLDSWSKYKGIISEEKVGYALRVLVRGTEVEQMMKVVGEEGTSQDDYVTYLKGNFLDSVYLQQNSFDKVDKAASPERQRYVFSHILLILGSDFNFSDKEEARIWFNGLRQKFIDYNYAAWQDAGFKAIEAEIIGMVKDKSSGLDPSAETLIAR